MEQAIPFISTLTHDDELMKKAKLRPQVQSINKLYGNNDGGECSYCSTGKSYSCGLVSNYLQLFLYLDEVYSPYTYEIMMQRGWRRCGTYYYKMDVQKSCCKQWTHRLNVNLFRIKKDQKKTVKKMIQMCYEPIYKLQSQTSIKQQQKKLKKQSLHPKNPSKFQQKPSQKLLTQPKQNNLKITLEVPSKYQSLLLQICQQINKALQKDLSNVIPSNQFNKQAIQEPWNFNFLEKLRYFVSKPEQRTDYYCNYIMLLYGSNKKKFITKTYPLLEFVKDLKPYIQKSMKLQKLGQDQFFLQVERGGYLLLELSKKLKQQKSSEFQIIQEIKGSSDLMHKEMVVQPSIKTNFNRSGIQKMQVQPVERSLQKIKKKASSMKFQKLQPLQFRGSFVISSDKITFGKLEILIVEADESNQSFKIYQNYSQEIHQKHEKTLSSYTDFLCQKALIYETQEKKALAQAYYIPSFDSTEKYQKRCKVEGKIKKKMGCYHMKYFLEKKLIAIGVVDILPNGLSSVYFFYDPEFKDKRLGVFSSIVQIEYIRYLSLTFPEFKYYYMGFYILDNDKMSYKGDYGPYQLLCPITYNYVAVDDRVKGIISKIVREGFKDVRLAEGSLQMDPDMVFLTDLGVYIDKNIKLMQFFIIIKQVQEQKTCSQINKSAIFYSSSSTSKNILDTLGEINFLNINIYFLIFLSKFKQNKILFKNFKFNNNS